MARRKTAAASATGGRKAAGGRSRAGSRATKTGRKTSAKAAKRSGRGASAKRAGTGSSRSARTSGRSTGAGKSAAGRSTPATSSAARGRSAGRRRKVADVVDVTAEVQRRWDLEEEDVPTPPSTLDLDRKASAASTGRGEMAERRRKHTAASPVITGGDVDADWEGAYMVGDESATADNPTPDQSDVEDIGRAVGVDYEDSEELKSTPKVDKRDRKRWELDPASAEDYAERNKREKR